MAEKRNLGRHRKRISLRFGMEQAEKIAFTEDISSTGIFIKTAFVFRPGSVIKVEFFLDNGCKVRLEAMVMWAKKVPPQMLVRVPKSGMGVRIIRFISGEAEYSELCEELDLPYAELL